MNIEIVDQYTVDLVKASSDKVFVFGDNLIRRGTGGQAIIRNEPNTFGVPTKRLPIMTDEAMFSDRDDEIAAVEEALRRLYAIGKVKTLVFPKAGLGTGLAQMQARSPKAWSRMCEILNQHFGYANGV